VDGRGTVTRLRGHVADRLIAEDRDPTPAESGHLDTCPECFAVARRRRPFDLRLAEASRDLVTEPLPREVLNVDASTREPRDWWAVGVLGVLVALVAVVGLGAIVALRGIDDTSVGAATSAELDGLAGFPGEHVVELPGGNIGFGISGDSFVVERLTAVGPIAMAKADAQIRKGGGATAMICVSPDGTVERYIFGRFDPQEGEITYAGPPAFGGSAPDGTFLFALAGPTNVNQKLEIQTAFGTGWGVDGGMFDAMQKKAAGLAPGTCLY
jgi:hypothetical protein